MNVSLVRLGAAALIGLALSGCGGSDGAAGPAGPAGPPGPPGPPGANAVVLTPNTPADEFAALKITATVQSVTIASAPVVKFKLTNPDGKPIVGFGSTSKSSTATVAQYPNLAFSLAKLVPGTTTSSPPINVRTPSKWVSYIVTTVPTTTAAAAPTRPTTDNTGTLVDNQDGTYTYTFYRDVTRIKAQVDAMTVSAPNDKGDLGDLTYEPSLTHRLTIQISGNAPGSGTNTPNGVQVLPGVPLKNAVDVIYDFIPATGQPVTSSNEQRRITTTSNCNSCHSTLGGIPGDNPESSGAGFHGGSRNNVEYCVVCHTEQRKYGRTEPAVGNVPNAFSGSTYRVFDRAVGNLPNMIHKAHLGALLALKNYDYAGVLFNEVGYPQDIRNCQKCHDGSNPATPQGDNWKNIPSRLACGACHDGINFATGTGVTIKDAAAGLTSTPNAHPPGPLADDTLCATCHGPVGGTGPTRIDIYHIPVTPPNAGSALHVTGGNANTNAAWIASNTSRLPAGAIKVSYEIQSVSRNASKQPVMVFRMLQNGARADINDFANAAVNPASGDKEIWDNFMGAPSAYFVFAVPQDGISSPADFNASVSGWLKSIWNGKASGTGAGTLTGPDANGFYTVTLTGVTIPDNAIMLTGGLGYTYNVTSTLPLTQTNLADYPVSPATATGQTNEIGGLIVIAPNVQKVAAGYTGRRAIVEDARCNACHQELGTFTEDAFHAGQRNDGTTCSWCHTPNRTSSGWSADSTSFVHAIHAGAKRKVPYNWHAVSATENFSTIKYPGVLARCEQCHLPGTYDFSASASANAAGLGADQTDKRPYRTVATGTLTAGISLSPYVVAGTNYGSGFSFNAATGATTAAAATTLVTSPTATVCSACHDSDLARSHITLNGGSLYAPRSAALSTTEQCFVCHASDRLASIRDVHAR